jgi:hypothetical protein
VLGIEDGHGRAVPLIPAPDEHVIHLVGLLVLGLSGASAVGLTKSR